MEFPGSPGKWNPGTSIRGLFLAHYQENGQPGKSYGGPTIMGQGLLPGNQNPGNGKTRKRWTK